MGFCKFINMWMILKWLLIICKMIGWCPPQNQPETPRMGFGLSRKMILWIWKLSFSGIYWHWMCSHSWKGTANCKSANHRNGCRRMRSTCFYVFLNILTYSWWSIFPLVLVSSWNRTDGWLVVWNMAFIFPYIGNSNPNWVIFLGLKPPIRWSFWISPNSSVMCWRWGKIAIGSRVNSAVLQLQLEQRPSGSRENPRPDVWRRLHGLLIRWSCNLTACWRRKNMLKTTCALWMLILCETGKSQVRRCTKFGKFPLLNSRGYSVPFWWCLAP